MAYSQSFDGGAFHHGDRKSMLRAAHEGLTNYRAVWGGRRYHASEGGADDFRYDDGEGWAPRITYWGSTETKPFDILNSSTNDSEVKNKEYASGLTTLARKQEGSVNVVGNQAGRVLQITNGKTSGEVYTNRYNGIGAYDGNVTYCPNNSSWYATWYARKSNSAPSNTGTVRQTMFFFGVNWNGSVWSFQNNISQTSQDANGRNPTNPRTGGTYFYAQNTMTTSWTKYEACFTFNGDAGITAMTIRADNDDGRYSAGGVNAGSKIYIDRLTLHPFNLHLAAGDLDGDGTQANSDLDDGDWIAY